MNVDKTRIETDSFGPVEVPAAHYWGAQTQRSLVHFAIGSQTMPMAIVHALAMVKRLAPRSIENSDFWPRRFTSKRS